MKDKRGISPLLATILLVALTITMAAIISNFLINKAKSFDPNVIAQQSVFCDEVTLGYTVPNPNLLTINSRDIRGNPFYFFENLTIVNKGAFSIQKFIITAPGYSSRPYPIINSSGRIDTLKPGDNNKYNLSIQLKKNINLGTNIIIVPIINDPEKNQLIECANRQLIINYSQLCVEIGKSIECT